jgi:arsenate reductase
MKRVLFACTENAGSCHIAAAFFNHMTNPANVQAVPAGTRPTDKLHSEVIEAMREEGLDLSVAQSELLTPDTTEADVLITMGCADACAFVPGVLRSDWSVPDPEGQTPERVREIRDEIRDLVWQLVAKQGWWRLRATSAAGLLR